MVEEPPVLFGHNGQVKEIHLPEAITPVLFNLEIFFPTKLVCLSLIQVCTPVEPSHYLLDILTKRSWEKEATHSIVRDVLGHLFYQHLSSGFCESLLLPSFESVNIVVHHILENLLFPSPNDGRKPQIF